MIKDDQVIVPEMETETEVELFDPFAHHFVSQNNKNDFLKALEEGDAEFAHSAIH